MVKAKVTRADHQRLIDSVEGESSVALLVHVREVTTWSRIWNQALDWGPRAVEDVKSLLSLSTDQKCPSCAEYINLTFSNMYARNVTLIWT